MPRRIVQSGVPIRKTLAVVVIRLRSHPSRIRWRRIVRNLPPLPPIPPRNGLARNLRVSVHMHIFSAHTGRTRALGAPGINNMKES